MAARNDHVDLDDADAWLEERRRAHTFEVRQVPFDELDGWYFEERTGNLVHRSRRFFSVEGLRARASAGDPLTEWHQPIVVQPEVGILGILMRRFDDVPHFLMQAKMEPGNCNLMQLSPTLQATPSNYLRVHQGTPVRYLEFFRNRRRGKVIADVLQSEHGWWFYRKRNRNIIVETYDDVPPHEDFRWLTADQINALMRRDNVVNMDSRSVLANLPSATVRPRAAAGSDDRFGRALAASRNPLAGSRSNTPALLRWLARQRCDRAVETVRVPLRGLPGWYQNGTEIAREDGRHFRVVGVDVRADSREVGSWGQPLLEPAGRGIAAFVVKELHGVVHVLMHVKVESGLVGSVELGPTVQCRPGNYDDADTPVFLDHVESADPRRVRFDAVLSEEGGRFRNAESRYVIVEAGEEIADEAPPGYAWLTLWQLGDLLRHGRCIQVQARTLIACMNGLG